MPLSNIDLTKSQPATRKRSRSVLSTENTQLLPTTPLSTPAPPASTLQRPSPKAVRKWVKRDLCQNHNEWIPPLIT